MSRDGSSSPLLLESGSVTQADAKGRRLTAERGEAVDSCVEVFESVPDMPSRAEGDLHAAPSRSMGSADR